MMKNTLTKAGYKAPIFRRERVQIEDNFEMKMAELELSSSCSQDFQHFIKTYIEFVNKFTTADELMDLVEKMLSKFNFSFIEGSKEKSSSTDLKEYSMVKKLLTNMVSFITPSHDP